MGSNSGIFFQKWVLPSPRRSVAYVHGFLFCPIWAEITQQRPTWVKQRVLKLGTLVGSGLKAVVAVSFRQKTGVSLCKSARPWYHKQKLGEGRRHLQ